MRSGRTQIRSALLSPSYCTQPSQIVSIRWFGVIIKSEHKRLQSRQIKQKNPRGENSSNIFISQKSTLISSSETSQVKRCGGCYETCETRLVGAFVTMPGKCSFAWLPAEKHKLRLKKRLKTQDGRCRRGYLVGSYGKVWELNRHVSLLLIKETILI